MNLYKYVSNAINKKLGFVANLEVPKNRDFGDFSTNAAMVGAKIAGKNPRELANEILPKLQELSFIENVSIAGPGFINIKIKDDFILKNVSAPKPMKSEKPMVIANFIWVVVVCTFFTILIFSLDIIYNWIFKFIPGSN